MMRIGTVRPEEAKVFDDDAGFHQFITDTGTGYGSLEVFWDDADEVPDMSFESGDYEYTGRMRARNYNGHDEPVAPGWYWWACHPGCLPDGEAHGPFSTSTRALNDAQDT